MKRTKLKAGVWQIGLVIATRLPGKTARENKGHRTVDTWKDQAGKTIGYTLDDVEEVAKAREKYVWCPVPKNPYK